MKFAFAVLLAFIVAVSAAPTQITDNNVGDVISVNVDADVDLQSDISLDSYSLDALYKNIQKILIGQNSDNDNRFPNLPNLPF